MLTNKNLSGFSVVKATELKELGAVLYRMEHDKTGLELVWLSRDEENKTFGIAFETLPWDDTGVFHILEHSVLCGSDKYPVKEPFVELMKSSMNTFLNALTFQDKTMYPIASRNDKDFINLMRVYLDAVFHPLIYSKPEIFHQEGWHYELDENGNASYKGVVFNEMKGAFASADRQVNGCLNRLLFPDSPYGFESGGDPTAIPDLTYEAFIDSHRRFYAPSNAYVFLDGDMDIEQVLGILNDEYLCHYERTERMAPPAMQRSVCGEAEEEYELAPGEALEGKVRLSFGKVIGTFADRETIVAAQILSQVLCGSNQSPLSKAILSQGLAQEVKMGVDDGILQPWMMLDVQNIKEEDLQKVQALIHETLENLAQQGLDRDQLEAVMANTEFKMRERDYGYYPQGLIFGFCALETWLYGGDPAANLEVGDLFENMRKKLQEGYFEQLIRDLLLNNPHSAKVVLRPSYTAGEKRREAEQQRLQRETSLWDEQQRAAVANRQAVLEAWQHSEDTPENLATIPQLALEDIPAQPEQIPTEEMVISGVPVIVHPLQTGGIVYVNLYFDAESCTEEELSRLSFACKLLGASDTQNHTAGQIINKTRLLCGNLGASVASYAQSGKSDQAAVKLCVSFSTLEKRVSEAVELVAEILNESVFADETAREILRQNKMQSFQRIVMGGNATGLGRIAAQSLASGVADECIGGVTYYQWLKQQDENWNFAALKADLSALLQKLVNRNSLTISVTGTQQVEAVANQIAQALPAAEKLPAVSLKPWGIRKEGIIIPADVAFAVVGGNIYEQGGSYCGQLQLASQVISLAYLWNAIRVQGGAYGAGMLARDTGMAACYSYRDPNGAGSLEKYRECGQFLRQFAQQTSDFTGFIIGAVSNSSPLMTPKTKAQVADRLYFCGTTWEDRCKARTQLLNTSADELCQLADLLEKTLNEGGICLVGGQPQLDKCQQLDTVISL